MIVITGATGQLGRAIVEALVTMVPKEQLGVSVRDPDKAGELAKLGVRVRQGDYAAPESLAAAFAGAQQVLLVSSNARAIAGDTLGQHKNAIAAAHAAGVRRIVYTSQMAASVKSRFLPAQDHGATEEVLRESGLAWTALRNGFHATNGILMLGDAVETGVLTAPADGKTAWTAHADLARAAATILTQEGRFEGPTPPLTGTRTYDLAGLAELAAPERTIRRDLTSEEDFRALLAARGRPEHLIDLSLSYFRASRAGEFANVDGTLETLLGRPPMTMQEIMARGGSKPTR